ncbi:MAG: hypothetical protein ABSG59_14925 [Verrucomicrobiota bacterium]|jgi:hypothetical protein
MDAAKAELMRALGRLVGGLSALFWGLPVALVVNVETARTDWAGFLGVLAFAPAVLANAWLWHGLRQGRDFQKQERVWQQALEQAEVFAIVNTGLAPFLFWWHRFPAIALYSVCVDVLAVSGLVFLLRLNQVLVRLSAMLPDETLRVETKTFTTLNVWMLGAVLMGLAVYLALRHLPSPPRLAWTHNVDWRERGLWLTLFLTLMPVAMTMALLWRIREAIFTSLFEVER